MYQVVITQIQPGKSRTPVVRFFRDRLGLSLQEALRQVRALADGHPVVTSFEERSDAWGLIYSLQKLGISATLEGPPLRRPERQFPADPRQGYLATYSNSSPQGNSFEHRFCGPPEFGGAWCPNCQRPLFLTWSLDRGDTRLNLIGGPGTHVPLLFCWRCNVADGILWYRLVPDGIRLLGYGEGIGSGGHPYEGYPESFPPAYGVLEPLDEQAQITIEYLNSQQIESYELDSTMEAICGRVRHQIGGEPFFIQREREPIEPCMVCERPMPFLAAVADDCLDPTGFTGNDCAQTLFFHCRDCDVIAAWVRSD